MHARVRIRACAGAPQLGTRHLCGRHFLVLKHLPRTRNGLCTPKRPRANLVQPTGWGFQAKIGLGGGLKKTIFIFAVGRCSWVCGDGPCIACCSIAPMLGRSHSRATCQRSQARQCLRRAQRAARSSARLDLKIGSQVQSARGFGSFHGSSGHAGAATRAPTRPPL